MQFASFRSPFVLFFFLSLSESADLLSSLVFFDVIQHSELRFSVVFFAVVSLHCAFFVTVFSFTEFSQGALLVFFWSVWEALVFGFLRTNVEVDIGHFTMLFVTSQIVDLYSEC